MADVQEPTSTQEQDLNDIGRLKRDLSGYREILLPLNRVFEWQKSHYPAILIGLITFVFSIIWYLEPSVLTTFSLLGVVICLIDFVVPTVSSYFFSSSEWTVIQERQYENICIRILNAKRHILNVKIALHNLKNDKPKVYLLVMMGAFAVLAWVGSQIDNLLLTYLHVVFFVMVPGLRKHGILQKITSRVMDSCSKIFSKGQPAKKPKVN